MTLNESENSTEVGGGSFNFGNLNIRLKMNIVGVVYVS